MFQSTRTPMTLTPTLMPSSTSMHSLATCNPKGVDACTRMPMTLTPTLMPSSTPMHSLAKSNPKGVDACTRRQMTLTCTLMPSSTSMHSQAVEPKSLLLGHHSTGKHKEDKDKKSNKKLKTEGVKKQVLFFVAPRCGFQALATCADMMIIDKVHRVRSNSDM